MKQKMTQAPVVPYFIDFTTPGTDPVAVFAGSGTIDIVMSALGATCGVVFGSSEDMDAANDSNSFPVGLEWVKCTIGPATRFLSVVSLDGDAGVLYYYFPGQTDLDV